MEENTLKVQQMEALEELHNYLIKLVPAVEAIIIELRGEKRSDTDELFNAIINGINWSIEVLNRTMDIVNENDEVIEKENINDTIKKFSFAIREHNELDIADILEKNILPFLVTVKSRVSVITNRTS
ncbi:molecular chaperone [Anaerocolumna sedimenticola]|uniref:Molecular chaperone n=1 Tax=Anaerocolumna sedimenticola TaxID=2696063 RepID=A0A6P1TM02_9FIRM|nr:molecular chaperone [Anaerocolumna sedimenticola]QHQ60705.1 molecular chaperone [Anaerocolumna sedimenticola]